MNDRLEKRGLQCWLDIPNVSVKSSINRYSVRDNLPFYFVYNRRHERRGALWINSL